jgi:hypothetical protein
MSNDPLDPVAMPPQAKRRAATEQRLRAALDRLLCPSDPSGAPDRARLTIAALAREAGVGRNAIYANHRGIIAELQSVIDQRPPPAPKASPSAEVTDWRAAAAELRVQNQRLATENAALLKRVLDAEHNAAQAEKKNARLTAELRRMQQPATLQPRASPKDNADT